jgi:tRNA (cytidine/uridine-2'-O-)-methyltransferase
MKIILYSPQIPQNTGNIARTCAATKTDLILVRPLGFSTSSRQMKRAGLDYWDRVPLEIIDDLELYLEQTQAPFYFFSSHAATPYSKVTYSPETRLIFGSETAGLPELFWKRYPERFVNIPMVPTERCLNLASSAAIALYEGLRQQNFTF